MIKKLPSGEMHGRVLRKLNVADFVLTETIYPPQSRLEKHAHANAYFCAVLQGSYTEHYGRRQLECQPQSLLFRPPNEVHADRFHDAGGHCLIIEIAGRRIENLRDYSLRLGDAADFRDAALSQMISRLNREFYLTDDASKLAIEGLMLEIMATAARGAASNAAEQKFPVWLKRAREILHDRYAEQLSLDDVAAAVGIHPVHLASVFRRNFSCTIGEYLRRLRVEFARREIAGGKEKALAEIALAAGFADQSHFTKIFKRETGVTPAEYRRSFRKS